MSISSSVVTALRQAAPYEAPIFVASADCKGVPLIKDDTVKIAAFEKAKKNPGNRRMAIVKSVNKRLPISQCSSGSRVNPIGIKRFPSNLVDVVVGRAITVVVR